MQKAQFLTPESVQKCFSSVSTNYLQFLHMVGMEFYNLTAATAYVLPTLSQALSISARNILDRAEDIDRPTFATVISGQTELAKSIQRHINQCDLLNCSDDLTVSVMKQEFAQYYPGIDHGTCSNYIVAGAKYIKCILGEVPVIKAPARSDFDYSIEVKELETKFNHPLEGTHSIKHYISKKDNERLMQVLNLKAIEAGIKPADQSTLEEVACDIVKILKGLVFEDSDSIKFKNVVVYRSILEGSVCFTVDNSSGNRKFFNREQLLFLVTFSDQANEFKIRIENSSMEHWHECTSHRVEVQRTQDNGVTAMRIENSGWIQYSQLLIEEVKRIIEELEKEVKSQ